MAYEIQSHQMLHNDNSLKKTDTKYLHLVWPTLKSVQSHCYLGTNIKYIKLDSTMQLSR